MLWVLNRNSETVSRIDIRGRRLLGTLGIGDTPGNVAASENEAWVATGCAVGGSPGTLSHLYTARDGGIELYGGDDVPLDAVASPARAPRAPCARTRDRMRARGRGGRRMDRRERPAGRGAGGLRPRRGALARRLGAAPPARAGRARRRRRRPLGGGDAGQDVIRRIDAGTGRVDAVVHAGTDPVAIAADAGAIWVANEGDDSVSRINPRTNTVSKAISVGDGPTAVASGGGAVWVAAGDGSVARIDPRTDRVVATVQVGHRPDGIALAGGVVWVTVRE